MVYITLRDGLRRLHFRPSQVSFVAQSRALHGISSKLQTRYQGKGLRFRVVGCRALGFRLQGLQEDSRGPT